MSAPHNLSEFFTWRTAILHSDLHASCRLTLLVLSCHMNEVGGSCFPSIKTLATETGMERKAVMRAIRHAIDKGWLSKEQGRLSGQKWRQNFYTAQLPRKVVPLGYQLPVDNSEGGPFESEGGPIEGQKVVPQWDTNSSINSSKNYGEENSNSQPLTGRAMFEALASKMRV